MYKYIIIYIVFNLITEIYKKNLTENVIKISRVLKKKEKLDQSD